VIATERHTPLHLTFDEFCRAYPRRSFVSRIRDCLPPQWVNYGQQREWSIDWWRLAFVFRIRCGDREGYFGPGKGHWCWPWNWYRDYYRIRFPVVAAARK